MTNNILLLITNLIKDNDYFKFNLLQAFKSETSENPIYSDIIKNIKKHIDSIKMILTFSEEEFKEKNCLDFSKTLFEFLNSYFDPVYGLPLELFRTFFPLTLISLKYIEYKYLRDEILLSIKNITETLVNQQKMSIKSESSDLLDPEAWYNLVENFLEELTDRDFFNQIMDIEYFKYKEVIEENKIFCNNDFSRGNINSIKRSAIEDCNLLERDKINIDKTNEEFNKDINNYYLEETQIFILLNLLENIFSFYIKEKLEQILSNSNNVFNYLFEIYGNCNILQKNNRISCSLFNLIVEKILNILLVISSNPYISNCNSLFIYSKFSYEIFDSNKLTTKALRNKKLLLINNLFFKSKDIFFEMADLISKGAYKFFQDYLLNSDDNNDLNICLNCLYSCFEAGEISDENNFLLTFQIECGLEALEKLFNNNNPKIREKVCLIFNKFIYSEKNESYLSENNFYVKKNFLINKHKEVMVDENLLSMDFPVQNLYSRSFEDFGYLKY